MEDHADLLQLLATVEASACLAPRDRLELGLLPRSSGDSSKGVDKLHSAAVESLSMSNRNKRAVDLGIRCLLALGELCLELECSERLGLIGGHHSIVRLMTREQCTTDMRGYEKIENSADPPTSPGENVRQQRQPGLSGRDAIPTDVDVVSDNSDVGAAGDEQEEEEEGDEDEVQSAAALVASRVVSTGCAFPMRLSFADGEGSSGLGRFPLQYDFIIADGASGRVAKVSYDKATTDTAAAAVAGSQASAAPADEDDAVHQAPPRQAEGHGGPCLPNAGGPQSSATETVSLNDVGESISILVRPVKERQHSQFDVGFVMWPAAVILSRLLCRDPGLVRGRRVLEIGAGLGLAGLVAARIQQGCPSMSSLTGENEDYATDDDGVVVAASVTLSDFNPVVLDALEANVALNADRGGGTKAAAGDAGGGVGAVHVRHLDWDKLVDEGAPVVHAEASGLGYPGCGAEATQVATAPAGVSSSCGGHDAVHGLEDLERDRHGLSDCESDSDLSSDSRANEEQRDTGCGGIEGIQDGERFDVIIASDHICQASDAEGTIRVLRAMLSEAPPPSPRPSPGTTSATTSTTSAMSAMSATPMTPMTTAAEMKARTKKGGEAHFVVAHPRTRWGVDALVPLLQKCPELCFTCEEICDPQLVAGLEEAAYLAWLYVRVWRRPEPAAADVLLVAG